MVARSQVRRLSWLRHPGLFGILYLLLIPAVLVVVAVTSSRQNTIQDVRQDRTIAHLCTLTAWTDVVWRSAIKSYTTLPRKTPDQRRLLAALVKGDREIQSDTTCPEEAP